VLVRVPHLKKSPIIHQGEEILEREQHSTAKQRGGGGWWQTDAEREAAVMKWKERAKSAKEGQRKPWIGAAHRQ